MQMRCEAEARAARDDVSDGECSDDDSAAASASGEASLGARAIAVRRREAGMPTGVDPMAIDWQPSARAAGAAMGDATTDEEPSQARAESDDDGDGGGALAAAGSPAALELAAMRASDELHRMTIGADSDDGGGGGQRPRRRTRRSSGQPGQRRRKNLSQNRLTLPSAESARAGEDNGGAPNVGGDNDLD